MERNSGARNRGTDYLQALLLSGVVAVAGWAGCYVGVDECLIHCWKHEQDIVGALDVDGDGKLELSCDVNGNPISFEVDVTSFTGNACPEDQSTTDAIDRVSQAIVDGTAASLPQSEIDTYEDFVDDLALEARNDCYELLMNSYGCDHQSAIDQCNDYIMDPARDALKDLT